MSSTTRRSILAASAVAGAVSLAPSGLRAAPADEAIRPFNVDVPDEALGDLRRRVLATRWPNRETVSDAPQGVNLATMHKLAQYWQNEHNWRKAEAKLNDYPQFITRIDGLDIHFIHVRSNDANALPLIITHGWPGSVIEQLKVVDPLTNPTGYGGRAADAFDVVIPSLRATAFPESRPQPAGTRSV